MKPEARLKITEIFLSLQGESSLVGWPTAFIRLTGCPLRCTYCDSEYAFYGGHWHSFDAVLAQVRDYGVRHVCVTGGEPLAQKNCTAFLARLCDEGYTVSLETSGAIDISAVDPRVIRVVDIKTPVSGEVNRNRWENIPLLTARDEVKFVICDRGDYEWARQIVQQYRLCDRSLVLFSPSQGQLPAHELADWILADRLPVRFQLQLHKVLWGNVPGK
ncbi:MAG: 7-carboxy-7-deazaguanine synthase QueE [Stenotrophobium sp.]